MLKPVVTFNKMPEPNKVPEPSKVLAPNKTPGLDRVQKLKKTLIIGASGFIGSKMFAFYQQQYLDLIGTTFSQKNDKLHYFELGKSKLADLNLAEQQYESVIFCAALTNIAFIDSHVQASYQINVHATLALMTELSALGLAIIFISSDNVFSGETGQYSDKCLPEPISEYGKQKHAVELGLAKITAKHTIVRLSKVVDVIAGDGTILDDISEQLLQKSTVLAADDLVFNPTAIDDIVNIMPIIQQQHWYGTLNFCSKEVWHRYDLTLAMAKRLDVSAQKITRIKFAQLPSAVKRPLNTSMIPSACFNEFTFQQVSALMDQAVKNRRL